MTTNIEMYQNLKETNKTDITKVKEGQIFKVTTGRTTTEKRQQEYFFLSKQFKISPTKKDIFLSPNIMVADTGSTNCTSGDKLGTFNVRGYNRSPTKTADNTKMRTQ